MNSLQYCANSPATTDSAIPRRSDQVMKLFTPVTGPKNPRNTWGFLCRHTIRQSWKNNTHGLTDWTPQSLNAKQHTWLCFTFCVVMCILHWNIAPNIVCRCNRPCPCEFLGFIWTSRPVTMVNNSIIKSLLPQCFSGLLTAQIDNITQGLGLLCPSSWNYLNIWIVRPFLKPAQRGIQLTQLLDLNCLTWVQVLFTDVRVRVVIVFRTVLYEGVSKSLKHHPEGMKLYR